MSRLYRRPGGQWMADGAFYALVVLAVALTGGLAGAVIRLWSFYHHELVNLCRRTWGMMLEHLSALPAFLPLGLLVLTAGVGGFILLRQVRVTRKLVGAAQKREIPLPHRLSQMAAELGLTGKVQLLADNRLYSFCVGLLTPRICLTTELFSRLEDDELRALLLHERHHLHSRDPLKVLVSRIMAGALFFLPLVQSLRDRYLIAKEIAADDAALQATEGELPLVNAMLKVLAGEQAALLITSAALSPFNANEARLERLLRGRPVELPSPSLRRLLITGLFIAIVLGVSYAPVARASQVTAYGNECANPSASLRPLTEHFGYTQHRAVEVTDQTRG